MDIKRTRIDTSFEKMMAVGMITSDKALQEILSICNIEMLNGSSSGRWIYNTCAEYYKKYEKAPGKHIQDLFEEDTKKGKLDDVSQRYIERVLSGLSDKYEQEDFNVEFLLDQIEKWARKRSLELLGKELHSKLTNEDMDGAEDKVSKYSVVRKGPKTWIDPFSVEVHQKMMEVSEEEPLFKLKGILNEFFGGQLKRGTFISIQAPEKKGKSWFLLEIGMMAYKGKCNVAFFEAGDLTERQLFKRMRTYICRHPLGSKQFTAVTPKFVDNSEGEKPFKVVNTSHLVDPMDKKETFHRIERWKKMSGKKEFRVSVHENSTLNVQKIKSTLDEWKKGKEGDGSDSFVPDLIIIDYADILAPEDPKKDFRHQENEKWKALRALSQKRDCCVITATQAAATSYEKKSVGLTDFSEDKRKYSHITACYSLNQIEVERELNILRVGQIMVREGKGHTNKEVSIIQCIEMGMPYVDSRWSKDVYLPGKKT